MAVTNDHDLITRMDERQKKILAEVKALKEDLSVKWAGHETRLDDIEVWQRDVKTHTKIVVGVASFVGGIVVFVADKVWDLWRK